MKVFKKQKRKLHHDGVDYLYFVSKTDEGVLLRCYTKKFKTTYFDFKISWKVAHDVNLNLPRVVKELLVTAIEGGWEYSMANKQFHLVTTKDLLEKLTLISIE